MTEALDDLRRNGWAFLAIMGALFLVAMVTP